MFTKSSSYLSLYLAYVKPWSLMHLVDTHRLMANIAGIQTPHGVEHFLGGSRLTETYLVFIVAAKLDISETLYDRSIQVNLPLTVAAPNSPPPWNQGL